MCFKVVIIGPESTGKSTLAKSLAAHFRCPWVPEFARVYLEEKNGYYTYQDLLTIAQGQTAWEDSLSRSDQELLICDTNLHVIQVWSEHRFRMVDPWIINEIGKRKYDFYLLTDIDIPWQDDPQREHPEPHMRQHFMELYQNLVAGTGTPFRMISGNKTQRLDLAISTITEALETKK